MFMDDILVYSKSITKHLEHLKTIFEVLKTNQLYAKNEQMWTWRILSKLLWTCSFEKKSSS
jgi:hypothetical protein